MKRIGSSTSATTPLFETNRLLLRPPTLDDVPAYTRHFVDYEVIRHLSAAVPWPYPDNGVADYLAAQRVPQRGHDHNRWMWGLFERARPDELIGAVELWRPGTPENRGFWLGRAYWGRGYMSEALVPIMGHAFDRLGFDAMVLSNAKGNLRSRRLKERIGARLLRSEPADFVDPGYRERELWELTAAQWCRSLEGVSKRR